MSIGETLAEARHRAGLSVEAVSQRTRIRPPIIRGIEADDYSACGGDFYARGDIRSIAQVVGTDPEPLILEYDQAYRSAAPVSATSLDELLSRSRPESPRRPGWLLAASVAVLAVAGFAGYWFMAGSGPAPHGTSAVAVSQASHAGAANGGHGGRPDSARSARDSTAPATPAPSPSAATPSAATPSAPAAAQGQARAIQPVSAAAFGPYGGGHGDDPQGAALAIDHHRRTAWRTDWYTTPRFGHLYRGTGLLLYLGRRDTITSVRVTLGPARGAHFQIRVGDRPHLAALTPVARSRGPGGVIRLALSSPARGRYVLVWFTKLPRDRAGTYRVAVHGIAVHGWS